MDTDLIKTRNIEELESLIAKYNIKETLADLKDSYKNIYTHTDPKLKRTRLLGVKEDYVVIDGEKVKTGKKKTVQLYVVSKRMYETLPIESLYEIDVDLQKFVIYFNELKMIKSLEFNESILPELGANADTIEMLRS